MKKYFALALVLLVGLTLGTTSCKEPEPSPQPSEKATLSVSPKEIEVYEGSKETIVAVATPNGTAITFTSSDPKIATVDNGGVVTGVSVGKTTIIVAAGELKEEVKVEVLSHAKLNSRMIGTKGNEKYPPFYIPQEDQMKTALDLITMANEQYGWWYTNERYGKNPDEVGYNFAASVTPDGNAWADGRIIRVIAYLYPTEKSKLPAMIELYTKLYTDPDKSLFESEEGKAQIEEFAKLYGFTEDAVYSQDGHVYAASHKPLDGGKPLMLILRERENEKGKLNLKGIITYGMPNV